MLGASARDARSQHRGGAGTESSPERLVCPSTEALGSGLLPGVHQDAAPGNFTAACPSARMLPGMASSLSAAPGLQCKLSLPSRGAEPSPPRLRRQLRLPRAGLRAAAVDERLREGERGASSSAPPQALPSSCHHPCPPPITSIHLCICLFVFPGLPFPSP